MLILSILGVLVACLLLALRWEKKEMERHEKRMSLIRCYTHDEEEGEGS